jgi:hypothetical protein
MKFALFLGALALIGITTGFYQRHEIAGLRSSIAVQQAASRDHLKTNAEDAEAAKVDLAELERLRADKLALMKLRGEISELRKMGNYTPAQVEAKLKDARSELAREQKRAEDLAAKKNEYLFGKMAKAAFAQAGSGLHQLLAPDELLLPQSSDDFKHRINALPEYNPYREQLLALINPTNQFGVPQFIEVLPSKKIVSHNRSLVLRERQPRQLPDGRWARYYSSTDGHVEEVILPDPHFETWEQQFK